MCLYRKILIEYSSRLCISSTSRLNLHKAIPQLSLVMIAAIYGLKALVFILRRKWNMIGWMFFYIMAVPVFSFFLPLYSFWKMDDFSWGATRVVLGESGKKMIVHVRISRSLATI